MAMQIAAHELRNCLSIILSTTQLMLEHPKGNQLHAECANRIKIAAKYASCLLYTSPSPRDRS